jgi:aspartate/tyrosine/aromatic aminotransferase
LNILSEFLFKFSNRPVYISNPGQDNLKRIFENRGLKVREYRYFDSSKNSIDIEGMLEDLKNA